jgi:hypothetical protein
MNALSIWDSMGWMRKLVKHWRHVLASSNGGLQHYLVIGSTKRSYSLVAAQAKGALIEWIRRQKLTFISVVFRCDDQHDVSCIVPLNPSDFSFQNAGQ